MNSTFNLVDRTQDVFNYAMLDKIYFDITDEEEFENVQFSEFRLENLIHVTQERDESHENTPNDISSINRFSFTRKLNLRKHISEVHDNINHMCGTCQKSFAKKCLLKIHIDTAHNNISYACDGCGKKFSTKRSLKTHIDAVYNDEPYLCVICVETFVNRRSLKVHLDTTHSGDVRACDICGEMYTRNDLHVHDLRVHVGRVRQVRSTTHSCDTCRKSFSQKVQCVLVQTPIHTLTYTTAAVYIASRQLCFVRNFLYVLRASTNSVDSRDSLHDNTMNLRASRWQLVGTVVSLGASPQARWCRRKITLVMLAITRDRVRNHPSLTFFFSDFLACH
uniref:C2H2-type domain-containing protein n=1 Tax=Trichogramma kaykai TaxID=54128 RepID=A0ABD2X5G9_9HYME